MPAAILPHKKSVTDLFNFKRDVVSTSSNTAAAGADVAATPGVGKYIVLYGDSYTQLNYQWSGVPDPSLIKGCNVFNIAFWMTSGPADNALAWQMTSDSMKKTVKAAYAKAGIKLCVSLFGSTDAPQTQGFTPADLATRVAAYVVTNYLDGVDIDYEEFDTFASGKSTPWLIQLTQELRNRLPRPYIISHAPVMPWFSKVVYPIDGGYTAVDAAVGSQIDFYNLQAYNQGTYTTVDSLLWNSGTKYPKSSLFEIIENNPTIDKNKLVIGKPAKKRCAVNGDGYMSHASYELAIKQAIANGWSAGVMFYEWPYITKERLAIFRKNSGI